MSARDARPLLSPEEEDDELIVSKRKLDKLLRKNQEMEAEIERLRKEAAELRRRLRVHENPNVPPSVLHHSPGFSRERPLTPPEGRKKPGPKPGHPGMTRAPLVPDRRVTLGVDGCGRCHGHRLRQTGTDTKTEVELPPPRKAVVTEFTIPVYECLDCGEEVRGTLPDGRTPTGYGPQLQSEVVIGKILERLPYRRLAERLAREGASMSTATIQGLVWAASDQLGEEYGAIHRRIRRSAVVHADETSFSVDGKKWWLWGFTTVAGDVLLVIRPSRGAGVVEEILGEEYAGTVVCDGWTAYLGYSLQRCWAHLLRIAKAAGKEDDEAKVLAEELKALYKILTEGLAEDDGARNRSSLERLGERELHSLQARYERGESEALRKVGVYLRNGMGSWLTFLRRPGVEPTNNRGERALREAVVVRKIVGTLRNAQGANVFARLMSVIGTWRTRGDDPSVKLYNALNC
jgi:transposase